MSKPPTVAEYAGAISRWCALHDAVPSVNATDNKMKAELDAFNLHLDKIAKLKREDQQDEDF